MSVCRAASAKLDATKRWCQRERVSVRRELCRLGAAGPLVALVFSLSCISPVFAQDGDILARPFEWEGSEVGFRNCD